MPTSPSLTSAAPPIICRFCDTDLEHTFVDLGVSPLANSYLTSEQLDQAETFLPLHVRVCHRCFLVQLPEMQRPEDIFSDYAYFSSYSDSWLDHAKRFAAMACERFDLGPSSQVVEVASNDGYLLRFFAERSIPVLGVEPAANVAAAAEELGIATRVDFFGSTLATELLESHGAADLLVGNNVLAHTPHLNDFVHGLSLLLAPEGVLSLEFPHLARLMDENQFDTIYHEHFSYFSLATVKKVLASRGLRIFDVEELPTHGGSLRLLACHRGAAHANQSSVRELLGRERDAGLHTLDPYLAFGESVQATKRQLLRFLIDAKEAGRSVVGYGAPAKGNTLLNYCGIGPDLLDYTVDRSPHKQGHYLPGTHIPILAPEHIATTQPDAVLILPWNLKQEIMQQMAHIRDWGGHFVVAVPRLETLP